MLQEEIPFRYSVLIAGLGPRLWQSLRGDKEKTWKAITKRRGWCIEALPFFIFV